MELGKSEQACCNNSNHNAKQVQAHEHQRGVLRKECPGKEDEHRQAGTARHEWRDEYRYNAAAAALNGTCCHDGRHVATESHEHWNERFAMQSHLVHEPVHDECRTCHISRILHQRDEEIEYENLRNEHCNAANAADYSVDYKVLYRSLRYEACGTLAKPGE